MSAVVVFHDDEVGGLLPSWWKRTRSADVFFALDLVLLALLLGVFVMGGRWGVFEFDK